MAYVVDGRTLSVGVRLRLQENLLVSSSSDPNQFQNYLEHFFKGSPNDNTVRNIY